MTALLTYFVHTFFIYIRCAAGGSFQFGNSYNATKRQSLSRAMLRCSRKQSSVSMTLWPCAGKAQVQLYSLLWSNLPSCLMLIQHLCLYSCPLSLSLSLSLFLPRSRWRSSLRSVPRSRERGAQLLRQSSSCCRHHWPALSASERSPHQIEKSVSRREIKRRTSCRRPLGWQQQQQQQLAAAA